MKKEHKEILSLISDLLKKRPELRFGQALTNLGVLEFADKSFPPKHNVLRDIYNDSDKSILEKVKKAKANLDFMPRLLFLDDYRMPADCISYMQLRTTHYKLYAGDWVIVRSYSEFVSWIEKNGLPDTISFDHDLGEEEEQVAQSGMDAAKWLVNYCLDNQLKLPRWLVHSANPPGYENIKGLLISFEKNN